jgi:hypothetical protein
MVGERGPLNLRVRFRDLNVFQHADSDNVVIIGAARPRHRAARRATRAENSGDDRRDDNDRRRERSRSPRWTDRHPSNDEVTMIGGRPYRRVLAVEIDGSSQVDGLMSRLSQAIRGFDVPDVHIRTAQGFDVPDVQGDVDDGAEYMNNIRTRMYNNNIRRRMTAATHKHSVPPLKRLGKQQLKRLGKIDSKALGFSFHVAGLIDSKALGFSFRVVSYIFEGVGVFSYTFEMLLMMMIFIKDAFDYDYDLDLDYYSYSDSEDWDWDSDQD